jgi:hypothetical protein
MTSVKESNPLELIVSDLLKTPGVVMVRVCRDAFECASPDMFKRFAPSKPYLTVYGSILGKLGGSIFDVGILERSLNANREEIGLSPIPVHLETMTVENGHFTARTEYLNLNSSPTPMSSPHPKRR